MLEVPVAGGSTYRHPPPWRSQARARSLADRPTATRSPVGSAATACMASTPGGSATSPPVTTAIGALGRTSGDCPAVGGGAPVPPDEPPPRRASTATSAITASTTTTATAAVTNPRPQYPPPAVPVRTTTGSSWLVTRGRSRYGRRGIATVTSVGAVSPVSTGLTGCTTVGASTISGLGGTGRNSCVLAVSAVHAGTGGRPAGTVVSSTVGPAQSGAVGAVGPVGAVGAVGPVGAVGAVDTGGATGMTGATCGAAVIAAPRLTAYFGCASTATRAPSSVRRSWATSGIRLDPPTSSTPCSACGSTPARLSVTCRVRPGSSTGIVASVSADSASFASTTDSRNWASPAAVAGSVSSSAPRSIPAAAAT